MGDTGRDDVLDLWGTRLDRRPGRPCAQAGAVLVEEVKSELANLEETIRKLDEKVRLVRKEIASDTFGWPPAFVGRVLVLPDSTTARQRVAALDPVLRVAFPDRGSVVRQWLREPSGGLAGMLFQPDIATGDRKSDG